MALSPFGDIDQHCHHSVTPTAVCLHLVTALNCVCSLNEIAQRSPQHGASYTRLVLQSLSKHTSTAPVRWNLVSFSKNVTPGNRLSIPVFASLKSMKSPDLAKRVNPSVSNGRAYVATSAAEAFVRCTGWVVAATAVEVLLTAIGTVLLMAGTSAVGAVLLLASVGEPGSVVTPSAQI
jgi:hypothetical protein